MKILAAAVAVAISTTPISARGEDAAPAGDCAPLPCCLARGVRPPVLMPGQPAPWCGLLVPREGADALAIHYAEPRPTVAPPPTPIWPFWIVGVPASLVLGGIVGAVIVWKTR